MIFIDLTSFRCPLALVKAKLALKQLKKGEELFISLSDTGSRQDVPRFLKKIGYEFSELCNDENILTLKIRNIDKY
ncbi:sulfurtransferase TusA family protein [Shewanella sp. D64]|uniref:sulfurtransferase TusA family protein n=1 Tax=unclassified Shewanella TaxID=196818 RepID=UPI0022BA5B5F|nr:MULTISPECIES: sulfurtransferase TusA family protein [unclassified Shewanella]MEC4724231.1 sulfurtransferase TusA family protein [Shewanella sp. D64]MEC4736251.1 sulfurtransferase TusA family protein [Shewanella sp. E94]WBJ97817.1 sulfurtransferase TusA family protein [Shewanella sp. MTB7]